MHRAGVDRWLVASQKSRAAPADGGSAMNGSAASSANGITSRPGQPVRRRQRHPAVLGGEDLPREAAIERQRQPGHGHVGVPAGQAGGRVGPGHLAERQRPPGQQLAHDRGDPGDEAAADAGLEPDPQHGVLGRRRIGHGVLGAVPVGQQAAGPGEQGAPGPGQRHLARAPAEQLRAQGGLQAADLLAQRRLRHEQPLGRGSGEAPFLGHGHEVAQVTDMHVHNQRLWEKVLDRAPSAASEWATGTTQATTDGGDSRWSSGFTG